MEYQLAQINIGRMLGDNIDDPIMKDFVDNLDRINKLAESSPGFVWRLKDDSNNATGFSPYKDDRMIINMSVWEDIESLEAFTYRTVHTDFLKRKKEWFEKLGRPHLALWWVEKGHRPTIEEAIEKINYLEENGPSEQVFSFRKKFLPSKKIK